MEQETGKRVCKRCLLKEYDEQTYREKLEKVLALMDEDIKADEELYRKRLAVCMECDKLLQGTCVACGCYVELRAAAKKNRCPHKRW